MESTQTFKRKITDSYNQEQDKREGVASELISKFEANIEKIQRSKSTTTAKAEESRAAAEQKGESKQRIESELNRLQNIEVPEEKVDLVDELAKKNDDLEDQLSNAMEDNIKLKESNAELSKDSIIRETASDLSEAQTEKLKKLAESTAYDSSDDYRQKIETLKESYFKKAAEAKPTETVQLDESGETQEVSSRMSAYLSALKQ